MTQSSVIYIKQKAVFNNIDFLKTKLGNGVRISSVVKANAYGHGIEQIVPLFESAGIDHFSVFEYADAVRVIHSVKRPVSVMIMGWISAKDIEAAIHQGIEFFVFDLRRLKKALYYAQKLSLPAKIHLEVETGMNRSGLNRNELDLVVDIINEHSNCFEVEGFCTHLAGAESISNFIRIKKQMKHYHNMLSYVRNRGIEPKYRHVANSAAAFVFPKVRMDMVRIGIMQYGFWSSAETFIHYISNKKKKQDPLERILDWKSHVMSVKHICTGEYIGYGISFLAQWDMKTALVPVGYFNGYSRSLSNKGKVLIRGQYCNVLGLVNMNMIVVDVSNIADVEPGDEVVIIGKQGDLEIKVSDFSDISNKLNYEVLTHLPANTPRKIIQ